MEDGRSRLRHSAYRKLWWALGLSVFTHLILVSSVGGAYGDVIRLWLIPLCLVLWCAGLADYSRSKGYSPMWGVFGIFALLGAIPLLLLPERDRHALNRD